MSRAREGDHLLLPARERAGALPGARDEVREQLLDERAALGGHRAALGEAEVLGHGEGAEDLAVLRDVADAAPDDRVRALLVDAVPVERDRAGALDEPEDRLDRRRLADAVAAEDRRDADRGHLEGHRLDHLLAADVGAEVLDREKGAHAAPPR